MPMRDQMTPAEQNFAEEHHRLYLKFLSQYGLDEEYYSVLMERYLRTVMKYCRDERLRQYKFSTILWRNLRSELDNYWKEQLRRPVIVYEECEDHLGEEAPMDYAQWKDFQDLLTGLDNETILLRNQGFKNHEIASIFGVTTKAIEQRFYRIRNKLKRRKLV